MFECDTWIVKKRTLRTVKYLYLQECQKWPNELQYVLKFLVINTTK